MWDYNFRKDEGQLNMVDFPDDEFSVVKLYKHIENNFMPRISSNISVDRFFSRHASAKVMKVSFVVVFKKLFFHFFCNEKSFGKML